MIDPAAFLARTEGKFKEGTDVTEAMTALRLRESSSQPFLLALAYLKFRLYSTRRGLEYARSFLNFDKASYVATFVIEESVAQCIMKVVSRYLLRQCKEALSMLHAQDANAFDAICEYSYRSRNEQSGTKDTILLGTKYTILFIPIIM